MDWLPGALTILAMELIARRYRQGWAVGAATQGCWAYLIGSRELWGLAPLCLALTIQYIVALLRWRRAW